MGSKIVTRSTVRPPVFLIGVWCTIVNLVHNRTRPKYNVFYRRGNPKDGIFSRSGNLKPRNHGPTKRIHKQAWVPKKNYSKGKSSFDLE